jgi:putative Mg2+ transporter-C (MgtC) family protein
MLVDHGWHLGGMELALFGRVTLAALLGWLIGFEREYRGKPAGERTFALLSLGSAAFTALGVEYFPASAEKVIAGVATGVGFIGAGLIFRDLGGQTGAAKVAGLTTAASCWAAASIGVLAGAGVYWTSILGTLLVLFVLEFNRLPFFHRLVGPGTGEQAADGNRTESTE